MAAPPQRLVLSGDYAKDVSTLSLAMQAVTSCLQGGIELGRNVKATVFTRDFQAPVTADLTFKTDFISSPIAVLPLGLWRTNSGQFTPISVAASLSWTFANGSISTPWVTGMTGTDKYRISLLAWES